MMAAAPALEAVRALVERTLAEMSLAAAVAEGEALLIQDGHYAGRRFLYDRVQAVWFFEERQIKFYAVSGELLRVVRLDGETRGAAA